MIKQTTHSYTTSMHILQKQEGGSAQKNSHCKVCCWFHGFLALSISVSEFEESSQSRFPILLFGDG